MLRSCRWFSDKGKAIIIQSVYRIECLSYFSNFCFCRVHYCVAVSSWLSNSNLWKCFGYFPATMTENSSSYSLLHLVGELVWSPRGTQRACRHYAGLRTATLTAWLSLNKWKKTKGMFLLTVNIFLHCNKIEINETVMLNRTYFIFQVSLLMSSFIVICLNWHQPLPHPWL